MTGKEIDRQIRLNGIPADEELADRLSVYLSLLAEWNEKMDLTAVPDEQEILDRHFIDSLTVLKTGLIPQSGKLIDVGTGAGFPGMALAMACPGLEVTLLDAQQKRITFLKAVRDAVGADNVTLIHARAEDGARRPEMREQFDIATARAVAPADVLCEYLLPFVRKGGLALCWKGPALKDEAEGARKAAGILGGETEEPVYCPVAGRDWEHMILPIRKSGNTPKQYPRKAGIPKQKPLGSRP